MRMQCKQSNSHQRLVNNGPLVVFGNHKNRDAPVIYHRRDGPILDTGPPVGTGPPGGVGPPRTQGNWLELILRKNEINGKALALKWFRTSEERNNINLNKRKMKMKNFKLKRLLGLAFVGGLTALNASMVFAAAGDTISNTATLNFTIGGVGQTPVTPAAPATFVEDRKVNFTVAEVGGATTSVIPGATLQVQTFTVTNNGNAPQDFLLSALEVGGSAFSPTSVQVFVDSAAVAAGTDTFLSGTDTDIFIDELPAGTARTVYIVSTIPGTATNGQVATMSLVAQIAAGGSASADDSVAANAGAAIMNDNNGHASPVGTYNNGLTTTVATAAAALAAADIADTAAVETVFADAAGTLNSAGAADAASNGQHSANDTYTVSAAALTVTKAVSTALWDPINADSFPKAIPGAYVTYTITVANAAGGSSASLTTLTDTLAASLALDPDFVDGATVLAPTSGADAAFQIDISGTGRAGTATTYCTATTVVDGCSGTLVAGGVISIDFATLAVTGAEAGYTAGELKASESIVITFNAIIQ